MLMFSIKLSEAVKHFFSSLYDLMKQKNGQIVPKICKLCN